MDHYFDQLPGLAYICIVDINGFVVAHVKKYRQDITGDKDKDLSGNRIKRIFENEVVIRSARVGLEGWEGKVGLRATARDFIKQGVSLRSQKGDFFLFQTYPRDMNQVVQELAVPIYVAGQHFGAVRVAYEPNAK